MDDTAMEGWARGGCGELMKSGGNPDAATDIYTYEGFGTTLRA